MWPMSVGYSQTKVLLRIELVEIRLRLNPVIWIGIELIKKMCELELNK